MLSMALTEPSKLPVIDVVRVAICNGSARMPWYKNDNSSALEGVMTISTLETRRVVPSALGQPIQTASPSSKNPKRYLVHLETAGKEG